MPDDTFPFGQDLQAKILALCAQVPGYLLGPGRYIRETYFEHQHTRLLFSWIQQYWQQYQRTPTYTVMCEYLAVWIQEFPRRQPEEASIKALLSWTYGDTLQDSAWVTDQIQKFVRIQEYKLATLKAIDVINKDGDPSLIPGFFNDVQIRLATVNQTDEAISILDPEQALQLIQREPLRDSMPTLWPGINNILGGGPAKQELITFAGAPSVGKSFMLSSVGLGAMLAGKTVYHITLEMSKKLVAARYWAALFQISMREVEARLPQYAHLLTQTQQRTGGWLDVSVFPTGQMTIEQLQEAILHRASALGRMPDMVIVDYLDLASPEKDERRDLELQQLYRAFRGMAVSYNFAGITASQVKQSAVGKEIVTLRDLAECFNKAAISDIIIAICQTPEEEAMFGPSGNLIRPGKARLFMAKNRNEARGQTVKLRLEYWKATVLEDIHMQRVQP